MDDEKFFEYSYPYLINRMLIHFNLTHFSLIILMPDSGGLLLYLRFFFLLLMKRSLLIVIADGDKLKAEMQVNSCKHVENFLN